MTELDDATVVRPRGAEDTELDDATVVRPRGAEDTEVDDFTIVQSARVARSPSQSSSGSLSPSGSVAPPVDEPKGSGRSVGVSAISGLDSQRRLADVPGRAPWEVDPLGERGVRPRVPVVYGPRREVPVDSSVGGDEVHRRLGDPPAATFVPVRADREALPSMAHRVARTRVGTLVGYAAAALVTLLGLWGVAALAFG